jgi:hypothetical protein
VIGGMVDQHGNQVSPAVAAESILAILGQSQTVSVGPDSQGGASGSQSGVLGSKQVPLGELISVNLELIGLRGQPVVMSWSIFQEGSHASLFGKWLNNFAAYRLDATTNDDTGTMDMWIPLPKLKGPFFVHLSPDHSR